MQRIETQVDPSAVYDDSSHDPMSRPSSILEQSMEVSMGSDNDDAANAPIIQPKIERPDTPPSVKEYYDDNEYHPQSPMDEVTDTNLTTQVGFCIYLFFHSRRQNTNFLLTLKILLWFDVGNANTSRGRRMA